LLNKQSYIIFLFLVLFISFSAMVQAESENKAGEPNRQEYRRLIKNKHRGHTVYPNHKKEIHFSTAPEFDMTDCGDLFTFPFSIKYGTTDSWKVSLEWDAYEHYDPIGGAATNGFGDLTLGTKYSFMNLSQTSFHLAIGVDVEFPVGQVNKQLSDGYMEYEPYFLLAKDFAKLAHLHFYVQTGINFRDTVRHHSDRSLDSQATNSLDIYAGFYIPVGDFIFIAEYDLLNDEWNNNGTDNEMYFSPQVTWYISNRWEVSLSAAIGLTEDADTVDVIGSVVYTIDVFSKK